MAQQKYRANLKHPKQNQTDLEEKGGAHNRQVSCFNVSTFKLDSS